MKRTSALILVDLQNDFIPGGALAVREGDAVIPVANKVQRAFDLIVATQDWHPRDHGSFAVNHRAKMPGEIVNLNGLRQTLWPVHCVQNTHGAQFVTALDVERVKKVIRKGTDPWIDSYSGFFDNGRRKETGLARYLKSRGVSDVYLMGLATDYCVKFTALDAVRLGFNVHLIEDGCRGVELKPGDVGAAIDQMRHSGVEITRSSRVLAGARLTAGKSSPGKPAINRAKRKVAIAIKPASTRPKRRRVAR
jgi:nicotinamidase/pyrazinamidase